MKNKKTLIYLADLTHTGPVISSEVFPLGIGLLASYLLTAIPDQVDVKIFKFPSDLSTALEKETPQIMGFSNYSWNCNLSYEYAILFRQTFFHESKTPEAALCLTLRVSLETYIIVAIFLEIRIHTLLDVIFQKNKKNA